ncbi:MAG: membrane protein insertion efficiency factor YidD [Gammaproteobacteria bacterium]|nr:membrane protein insertion efficiency factor YidD [Gammaproteobacteria bacterium]
MLAIPARLAGGFIWIYQRCVSPFFGPRCRFYPTCSTYAAEAVRRFGVIRGGWLALSRLVRCNPWCDGGVDTVPERFSWRRQKADESK